MTENITDEELVKLTRAGNEEAENEILSKYKKIVKHRAASYFMAGAEREDLVQEGMIGVFKAIRDYDPSRGASFSTFAELCIQRQIITAVKSAARLKHSPLNDSLSFSKPVAEQEGMPGSTLEDTLADVRSGNPEDELLFRENLDFIENNIDSLFTALEWKAWQMYMQGCSYKEIAARLDKTSKAVDNAIRRAKKKLSDALR